MNGDAVAYQNFIQI